MLSNGKITYVTLCSSRMLIAADFCLRWEKEHKYSQAACWLVFTRQYKAAIELLLRSRGAHAETHHMMSGMLTALTPPGANKNSALIEHCQRLIITLGDPYFRVLLSHLTVDDWIEVLDEGQDGLPLRERLAIAFQFLGDKELTRYLNDTKDSCIQHGVIEGLLVTGLTPQGMDILQAYLDITGDLQSVAILGNLNPARARDPRSGRWLDRYRDLLDQWKLFHFRCQLDIDQGRILQGAIERYEIEPFEWTPKQVVLRCNYCSKPFNPPLPNKLKASRMLTQSCPKTQLHLGYGLCTLWTPSSKMFDMSHDIKHRSRRLQKF